MERISIDSHNRVVFYGNRVGYVSKNGATVDLLFKNDELKRWLESKRNMSISWTEGVYDSLLNAEEMVSENTPLLKSCRIWQLKPNVNVFIKFISYDEMIDRFGEPDLDQYKTVFDGELSTNDLEKIYTKFNIDHPVGFTGHLLSMSDIVELYDYEGSEFYYVDRFKFMQMTFMKRSQSVTIDY